MRVRSVVIIVLLMLVFTVGAQNTGDMTFRLFFWDFTMSRVLLLAGALVVGMIVGLLLGRPWKRNKVVIVKPHGDKDKKP